MERMVERAFTTVDADGDGVISLDEARAAAEQRFTTVDADGDGVVTEEEFAAMRAHKGGERGERDGARWERMRERMQERRAAFFGELDRSGDGTVTRDDVMAWVEERFAAIDADGDGQVTPEELRAHAEAMAAERHGRR